MREEALWVCEREEVLRGKAGLGRVLGEKEGGVLWVRGRGVGLEREDERGEGLVVVAAMGELQRRCVLSKCKRKATVEGGRGFWDLELEVEKEFCSRFFSRV